MRSVSIPEIGELVEDKNGSFLMLKFMGDWTILGDRKLTSFSTGGHTEIAIGKTIK